MIALVLAAVFALPPEPFVDIQVLALDDEAYYETWGAAR